MTPPEFLLIPYTLIADDAIAPLDERVYGIIYWLTQLRRDKCIASNPVLAALCRTTANALQNSLVKLENQGYIRRIYKDETRRVRDEIIPLVVFGKVSPRNYTSKPVDKVGISRGEVPPTGGIVPPTGGTQVPPTGDQKNSILNNSSRIAFFSGRNAGSEDEQRAKDDLLVRRMTQ